MTTMPAPPGVDDTGELWELEETYAARPLANVLEDVVAHNKRFVYHADDSAHDLIALWVAHAHGLDKWDYSGRLYVHAPQPGVGKSMQAKVMRNLCPNRHHTVGVSAPGLFRKIALARPTVFLDEAHGQFDRSGGKDKVDVTSVINGGYEPGNFITRSVGGQPVDYETYCAMTVVGIDNGSLPEDTRTRCIPVRMVPKPAEAQVERFRYREHADFEDEIRWQLSNAAMDWVIEDCPLDNRQADLWESLWVVAKAAGGSWPERCRVASEKHVWTADVPEGKRFLAAVKDWFDKHPEDTKVQSSVLAAHVSSYDDLPTMQGKGVAQRMKGYGVVPAKRSESWYHRSDLEPVFAMWL